MQNCCAYCKRLVSKSALKYCSNKCQCDHQYVQYIVRWKLNEVDGSRGLRAKGISRHLRRYLFEKYNAECSQCGWKEVNDKTGEVPLEIDHLNGDADDNREQNLRLLCPNCHSLTPNFRNLNKGLGRPWRRQKYVKNQ